MRALLILFYGNRMPPGKDMDDWFTMFKSGMWRLRYQLTAEGSKRFFNEFLPLLHETKAKALGADDQKSWYLVYIGTRPGAQGKGYAKALIEMVTKHVSPCTPQLSTYKAEISMAFEKY